jgi:energy-coupling factor transport system substrate-specific component
VSWQVAAIGLLALVVLGGFAWYERSRPSARIVAAVAALAALGVAGRVVLAPVPNVVATTDVALLAGYALGGGPGFAVGALSGLVSNFWLGQGPWTPWQMAGWGLVGVGGAALARFTGRSLNRWWLAAAAAVAGLAYGALLDLSVMVQYGGEQSVDRYVALSARGIPFNVAHALGNAALMLAAGPAMVRILGRYRERFEVAWRDAPLTGSAAALLAALCLALPLLAPSPALAGDEAKAREKEKALAGLSGARSWLLTAQNDDGGFGAYKGDDSSPGMTGWAMIGLQAAGMNPRDAARGGKSPVQYLRSQKKKIKSTGDLERTILAIDGAGLDPRDFDGADLVERLRNRQRKDGSFEQQVNLTAFAILAQRAAGVSKGNVGKAAKWLRAAQNRNGGWGSTAEGQSEPDSTGSALQALAVAPGDNGKLIKQGAKWLERSQRGDGGWALTPGAATNSQSTAWAIQGLEAAGRNAAEIRENGSSGLDFLRRRQSSKGFIAYSTESDQTPVWVTAQAMTGTARESFPIAPVALAAPEDTDTGDGDGDDLDDLSDIDGTTDSYDSGYDGGYSSGYDGSYDSYDYGDSGSSSTGTGSGPGSSSPKGSDGPSSPTQGIPGDAVPAPDEGTIEDGVAELAQPATAPIPTELLAATKPGSPLPETNRMLAGLGVLALVLAAGFFWYRRRLP